MVNEAAKIIADGVALRASDIDLVKIHGYGFPRWRGGPMHYADQLGLARVRDRLEYYADRSGDETLKPAPFLQRLAAEGRRFGS